MGFIRQCLTNIFRLQKFPENIYIFFFRIEISLCFEVPDNQISLYFGVPEHDGQTDGGGRTEMFVSNNMYARIVAQTVPTR